MRKKKGIILGIKLFSVDIKDDIEISKSIMKE